MRREWPCFISSAFPRFHDIYEPADVRDHWGYLGDRKGQTLRQTLSRALTNSSSIVQIVTWNDFAEGTMVEPTVEYGFRDLGIIQEHHRSYFEADFPFGTNDLELPLRLYHLRRSNGTNVALESQLDAVSHEILIGNLPVARGRLDELESTSGGVRSTSGDISRELLAPGVPERWIVGLGASSSVIRPR